jgi:hypothetical protein
VWGAAGSFAIEGLGQVHPHFDTPQHYLPAALALPALASIAIAALLWRSRLRGLGIAALLLSLLIDAHALPFYFRQGRADWRPLARFLRERPRNERIYTENAYSALCVAFYVEGPEWLYRGGRMGRDIWNLDGELVRVTWSWRPGTTAWLVLGGEPPSTTLRGWGENFSGASFPTAEGTVLKRLDPELRAKSFGVP